MLTRPANVSDSDISAALHAHWGRVTASVTYRPVGFGSHHWAVVDDTGAEWFVTVDELAVRRRARDEPLDLVFARLRAAFGAAAELRQSGLTFVVAAVPDRAGGLVARLDAGHSIALFPHVVGQAFGWGEFTSAEHRRATLEMVVATHAAPAAATGRAVVDDHVIPFRDEIESELRHPGGHETAGPYARPLSDLLTHRAPAIRRVLARYDQLAGYARSRAGRQVLTHGEPHPGNTMLAADGWKLIDWDTVLLAPPERDLWSLDPGDGTVLRDYAAATGVQPLPDLVELYRIGWDIADLASAAARFHAPHADSADDRETWAIAAGLLGAGSEPAVSGSAFA